MSNLYEYDNSGTSADLNSGNIGGIGQSCGTTFTVGTVGLNRDINVSSVKVKIKRVGTYNPDNGYWFAITEVDMNGKPTDTWKIYTRISESELSTDFAVMEKSLSTTLLAGTKYALILMRTGSFATNEYLTWSGAGAYSGGSSFVSDPDDMVWTAQSGDLYFEIWGDIVPITKDLSETLNLNGIKYNKSNKLIADTLRLGDNLYTHKIIHYTQDLTETFNSLASLLPQNLHHLFKGDFTENIKLNDTYGKPNEIGVYVYDSINSKWIEIEGIEYFKVTKRLNQMSLFEIDMPQIEADQKLYVKEFAKVLLISNNSLILKGRIQKITYETSYSATIEGFGMEAVIQDKEYKNITRSPEDEDRVQYDNISAQTIAKELLSTNADGISPWTMQPRTSGLFATDYGLISMRFEYANKLTALGNLANSLNYDWWIDHDPISYTNDFFNMASIKGNQTNPSLDVNRQFTITGNATNAEGTDYQKDVTNIANYVKIIGYGDGINQLFTSTYNASPIWNTLSANINSTAVTIPLINSSAFAVSGTVRIANEIITYTGNAGNSLTGCTRGTSGTEAKAHRTGCYIEKYVIYTSPEANSSISDNGLMELTLTYRDIRDESTLELIASKELIDRMDPIERITITPIEPQTVAETLQTGDLVSVIDAESSLNSNYRIIAIIYENNYGILSVSLEASNKSLTFIEQMQKEREKNQSLQKYMQGATNIYCLNYGENIDNAHAGYLRFYVPEEAIAVNHIKLNFKMKNYRADSQSVTSAPISETASGFFDAAGLTHAGTISYISNPTLGSHFVSYLNFNLTSNYCVNYTGTLSSYYVADIVQSIDSGGLITNWYNTPTTDVVGTTGTFGGIKPLGSANWTNNTIITGFDETDRTFTWSYPLGMQLLAPNVSGTFDRIKVTGFVYNGFNETKTPTIYIKRNGSTVATYTPTMTAGTAYQFSYEDTTDHRGDLFAVEITSSAGFNVNHTDGYDISKILLNVTTYCKSTDALNFGIYENSSEFTPPGTIIVTAGLEGSETAVGTYTSDQTNIDLTNLLAWDGGNWYVVKLNSNHANNSAFGGRMRLEANLYTQIFLESK